MASYQRNPMFGQAYSEESGWAYDTGQSSYSGGAYSPGYTSGAEGSGASVDWTTVIATGLGTIGQIFGPQPTAQVVPVGAQPIYTSAPPVTQVPAPGTVAAAGSINSNVLLIGGLGLAAMFFFRKK